MKSSFYNISIPFRNHFIVFNGLSKRFFLISKENKDSILKMIASPDTYQEEFPDFMKLMMSEGFIIEDNYDELSMIRDKYENMLNGKSYKLMILPTYSCNVSCWYCTQSHRSMSLNADNVRKIKKHIEYYLEHNDINNMSLSWFGGEPLLGFSKIKDIAIYAQNLCKSRNISYNNTITTNGILLSKKILETMKELNFNFFQITVDGTKKEHDNVKLLKYSSSYDTIMNNIKQAINILPHAEICLRYNFTMANLKPDIFLSDLNRQFTKEQRKRISLSLMKVWQQDDKSMDSSLVNKLADNAANDGYKVNVGAGWGICYVEKKHFNCIFPNGLVDKCDNDDPDLCRGEIMENGEIVWREVPQFNTNTIFHGENECIKCRYLPICYGPCPHERDRNKKIKCRYTDPVKRKKEEIFAYCENILKVNNMSNS